MLKNILKLPRIYKQIIAIIIDLISLSLSYFCALSIRFTSFSKVLENSEFFYIFIPVLIITILVFMKIGLYKTILRYASVDILKTITLGIGFSAIALLASSFFLHINLPRAVPFLYFVFAVCLVTLSRFSLSSLIKFSWHNKSPVIIYGAGDSGLQLLKSLSSSPGYNVKAFIDDDVNLHKRSILGVDIYPSEKIKDLIDKYKIKTILLAMPSAPVSVRKRIITSLSKYQCEVLTIPGLQDIISGKAELTTLKKILIDDLLGRDAVEPIESLLTKDISDKVVMVTGAGGSIGSELCRQIITNRPKAILLFELNEFSLYNIYKELSNLKIEQNLNIELFPLLGSVLHKTRLQQVITTFCVNTIYHAAAYKHVPLVEYNMAQGVRNNVFGTLYCAQAAIEGGVEAFVLISTDKAVRPTNTMGASKRMAELILQALTKEQTSTRFCMVRFGNVLGSSGSVVPLFEKQIKDGGPITLTHPDITRYFMTIPEASQLVIQAGAMGKSGEIFLLDMGESVKIITLAERMIRLSGMSVKNESNPQGDIEIQITGLRPGEKLYEELLVGESVKSTLHPRIMISDDPMMSWEEVSKIVDELDHACEHFDYKKIRELLLKAPTEFSPTDEICDLVWMARLREKIR